MAIVARAGTAVVKTRFCVRHSPSLTSQTRPVEQLYHCCVPGLRSVCPGCFCGMLVSYRPLAKLRHLSSPKRRGISIRRRFGFESRTRLAPRLVRQPSQHSGCLPWPSTKHRGSQRKREREPGLRRRRGSKLSSSAQAGQPASQGSLSQPCGRRCCSSRPPS